MSEIKVNLPAAPKAEKPHSLQPGRFYFNGEVLVFVSGRQGPSTGGVTQMGDVKDGMLTVAAVSGDYSGWSLYGLLGSIENYEEVDVEITVKRK